MELSHCPEMEETFPDIHFWSEWELGVSGVAAVKKQEYGTPL